MRRHQRAVASVRRAMAGEPGVAAVGIDARSADELRVCAYSAAAPDDDLRDRLDVAATEVIADFPYPERGDPRLTLAIEPADPAWACLYREPIVLIGRVAWALWGSQPAAAAELVALSRRLDGTPTIGTAARAAWWDQVVRAAQLDPPLAEPTVRLERGVVELRRVEYGWISSHEQGWRATPYATIPVAVLPADPARAARFLHDAEHVAGPMFASDVERGPRRCRFCGKTFAPLEFDSGHDACHGCAVSQLGVVY
jgi:hypothetical protein